MNKWNQAHQQREWILNSSSFWATQTGISPPIEHWEAAGERCQTDTWKQSDSRIKVTSGETGHLSSYLCTPNGNQQQTRWCQTGRSSTGCWKCCSAAAGLLYLYYKSKHCQTVRKSCEWLHNKHMLPLNYMLCIKMEMKVKIPSP